MNIDIPDLSGVNVLIVGDVMLDRYWHGDSSRISPEAPVPVVKIDQRQDRPGGAANVALNVCALVAKTTIIGTVGDDEAASILKSQLSAANIRHHFVTVAGMPTVTKLRVLSRHQQLLRMDFEQPHHSKTSQQIVDLFSQQLPQADVVIFSDYQKGTLNDIQTMIARAKAAGIPVFVDPKQADVSLYQGATLLKPNLNEFYAMAGHCQNEQEMLRKANLILQQYQLTALLITRGEHGMTLLPRGQSEYHLPTRAKEVFDVTGAGDTVIAVLATTYAAGCSLSDAMALANAAAGIVVSKLGASTVSLPELQQVLQQHQDDPGGVVNKEQLQFAVNEAKEKGQRIVMTNGCFDILHAGHVHYLKQAKLHGDKLIVAVNSDASVERLKGDGRPLNSLDKRMAVLAGLSAVDWVVPFDQLTPEQLISDILPDVLVKGGDYQGKDIAGGDVVVDNGGRVQIVGIVEGCSSSHLLDCLNQETEEERE